jgi:predicted PurR-regulated permease PerM
MVAPSRPTRLHISARSVAATGLALAATLVALHVLASATRVLIWIASAGALAGLLHPTVTGLSRVVKRRGFALVIVLLASFGLIGVVTYGAVDDVVRQMRALQRAAPRQAERLERGGRFAEAARAFHLASRTRAAVDELPERLRGGNGAQAARTAVSRGLALLATLVLTVFLLLNGQKLVRAALAQIADDERRANFERIVRATNRNAFGYLRGTIAMAAIAGAVAYIIGKVVKVPGPAPLALWVAMWDVVPVIGAAVGAFPLIALATAHNPVTGALVALAIVAYQAAESLFAQPRIERSTVKVGPFLTALAGFAGFELYRLIGALLAITAVALATAAANALAPESTASGAAGVPRSGG